MYVCQFFTNKGSFSHTMSEMKSVTPNFVCISETNNSLFDCSKNFKNTHQLENACTNMVTCKYCFAESTSTTTPASVQVGGNKKKVQHHCIEVILPTLISEPLSLTDDQSKR